MDVKIVFECVGYLWQTLNIVYYLLIDIHTSFVNDYNNSNYYYITNLFVYKHVRRPCIITYVERQNYFIVNSLYTAILFYARSLSFSNFHKKNTFKRMAY